MALLVECDVCRYQYHIDESRRGDTLRCKYCEARFDAVEVEPQQETFSLAAWWIKTRALCGQVGSSVLVIGFLAGMMSLIWIDPRELAERSAASAARTNNRNVRATARQSGNAPSANRLNNSSAYRRSVNENLPNSSETAPSPLPEQDHPADEATPPAVVPETPGASLASNTDESNERTPKQKIVIRKLRSSMESIAQPRKSAQQADYTRHIPLPESGKVVTEVSQLQKDQLVLAREGAFWFPFIIHDITEETVLIRRVQSSSTKTGTLFVYEASLEQLQLAHDGIDDLILLKPD